MMARLKDEILQAPVREDARIESQLIAIAYLPVVDVSPPGYSMRVQWNTVPGASKAEVTNASVNISPAEMEETLGDLPVKIDGSKLFADISVSDGKRIKALNLQNLKDNSGALLKSASDLSSKGLRLVVTTVTGGQASPPTYAVPACPKRGMLPPALSGASYTNGTLSFDQPLTAGKIRLALARNDFPESFAPDPISLGKVGGVAVITPKDLTLSDPKGGTAWAFPGEMPSDLPAANADLRLALETVAKDALTAKKPLDFIFKLKASNASKAGASFSGASGYLVREFPGVLKSDLQGDPDKLALEGVPLADETPYSALGDLTVRYQGIRILESVSDSLPAPAQPIGGVVVTGAPVRRDFPPAAFGNLPIVRVGLIGRAPEDCELVVQIIEAASAVTSGNHGERNPASLASGVKRIPPSPSIHTVWIDIPQFAPGVSPLGLAVHANQGRFFWASSPVAQNGIKPLVMIAVSDPDPGGRTLKLSGSQVMKVDQNEVHQVAFGLPTSVFKSRTPAWESNLFLKVELSDLTLRYRR